MKKKNVKEKIIYLRVEEHINYYSSENFTINNRLCKKMKKKMFQIENKVSLGRSIFQFYPANLFQKRHEKKAILNKKIDLKLWKMQNKMINKRYEDNEEGKKKLLLLA